MAVCPDCKKKQVKLEKKWKYGPFDVEAYSCKCGTEFRSYKKDGVESFKLKKNKSSKRHRKPWLTCA